MARVNGSGFKMKSSPAKGIFDNLFKGLGARKTDMGELRAKQARSSKGISEFEYRKTKEYRTEKAKRSMVDKNKDNISDLIQPHSITDPIPKHMTSTVSSKAESNGTKTKKTSSKTKVTGAIGSKTRKEQYDAKGWKYDDSIKGYNRDGTEISGGGDTGGYVVQTSVDLEKNIPQPWKEGKYVPKTKSFKTKEEANAYIAENEGSFGYRTDKDGKKIEGSSSSSFKKRKKSPLYRGIGSYAKQAKGSRGYKMKRK